MNTHSFQNHNLRTSRNMTGRFASDDSEQRRFSNLGNATIFFTMAVPASSRAYSSVVSASLSSFPRRQSSIVNTFKQQQRINLIRMMFHEPLNYHKISDAIQTSRAPSGISETCDGSCCKHMGDSSELNQSQVSTTYKPPSPRIGLTSRNLNKQRHNRSLCPTSRFQSPQRTYVEANLQYKTNMDHLECSTCDGQSNRLIKKGSFFTYCQSPRRKGNKTVERYLTMGEDLIQSVTLHKKEQEKYKLMRERQEYYKRTRHILNYYLNETGTLEDPEAIELQNKPKADRFLTSDGGRPASSEIPDSNRARS